MNRRLVGLGFAALAGAAALAIAVRGNQPGEATSAETMPVDANASAAADGDDATARAWRLAELNRAERNGPPEAVLSPADQLPSRAEAARALLVWGECAGEGCPPPRRDTILGALRCRPDAIFRGDPVKVICRVSGYHRLGPGRREPLPSDCYYFWRGRTSGGPWQVLAVPDAEFCEE